MGDRLQLASLFRIGEHALAHGRTVEPAIAVQDLRPELRDQLAERRAAGRHDVARDLVGVEHRHAELRELFGDSGLAAGDAAGQSDQQGRGVLRFGHCADDTPAKCRYDVTMSSPHSSAIQPAAARYGPNGIGMFRSRPRSAIIRMPITAPVNAASRMIGSSICQPSHAPSAANSLKSPYPMPSLPVSSRKAW